MFERARVCTSVYGFKLVWETEREKSKNCMGNWSVVTCILSNYHQLILCSFYIPSILSTLPLNLSPQLPTQAPDIQTPNCQPPSPNPPPFVVTTIHLPDLPFPTQIPLPPQPPSCHLNSKSKCSPVATVV